MKKKILIVILAFEIVVSNSFNVYAEANNGTMTLVKSTVAVFMLTMGATYKNMDNFNAMVTNFQTYAEQKKEAEYEKWKTGLIEYSATAIATYANWCEGVNSGKIPVNVPIGGSDNIPNMANSGIDFSRPYVMIKQPSLNRIYICSWVNVGGYHLKAYDTSNIHYKMYYVVDGNERQVDFSGDGSKRYAYYDNGVLAGSGVGMGYVSFNVCDDGTGDYICNALDMLNLTKPYVGAITVPVNPARSAAVPAGAKVQCKSICPDQLINKTAADVVADKTAVTVVTDTPVDPTKPVDPTAPSIDIKGALQEIFGIDTAEIQKHMNFGDILKAKFKVFYDISDMFQNLSGDINDKYKFYMDLPSWLGGGSVCILDLTPQQQLLDFGRTGMKYIIWVGFAMYVIKQHEVKFEV